MLIAKTPLYESILEKSNIRAKKNNRALNVVDLFIEVLNSDKGQKLILALNVDSALATKSLEKLFDAVPGLNDEDSCIKEYNQIVDYSLESASELGNGFIDVEHVMYELLNSSVTIRAWAHLAEFPLDQAVAIVETWLRPENAKEIEDLADKLSNEHFPTLEAFCTNLTEKVANDDSFCHGRKKEIDQILDILCRQKKSNVILMGEPGVGRKTTVQGVIEKILTGESSEILKDKEFYLVNLSKMMAGTAMFGSLEARFVSLTKEIEQHGSCVLVIDNLSQVFGSGAKESVSDVSNLLRPILEVPGVSVIGICTQAEYKKFEKEQSFISRFEVIKISEPSKEETREILINSISELEYYHNVDLPPETIDTILDLCERFLPYRKFPEKAFDFLDHLGAKAKNKHFIRPESLIKLERKLADSFDPQAEKDSPLYNKMKGLLEKYSKSLNKWLTKLEATIPIVSPQDAVETFAEKYKITENQLKQLKNSTIDDIRAQIKSQIFGQDHAIDKVMDVLLCSKVGLRDKNKPLAKFLFVGQTSVGKAQPLFSKIKTKNGWITMGEAKVGDKILDINGEEQSIEAIFPQNNLQKVFKIETLDGRSCLASDNHLWEVYHKGWANQKWRILNSVEMKSFIKNKKNNSLYIKLPFQKQKDCTEDIELPIHPYVLGVLLGDGSLGKTVKISSADSQIIDQVRNLIDANQELVQDSSNEIDFYFREKKLFKNRENKKGASLTKIGLDLESLGLRNTKSWNKFIPKSYLNASYKQRLDLLNGILDTDGTISKKGSISITTTSYKLAQDIQKLSWSLGCWSKLFSYDKRKSYTYNGEKRFGRPHFRVSIRHSSPSIFFKLERKRKRIPSQYFYSDKSKGKELKVQIKSIEYVGEFETKCIKVSSKDSLYITDDFIVTHNTELCKQLAVNFFGDESNLLKLDMSEFQERGAVSSLIGTSAGYIGYGDGGRLTEYVKHNPNCVVLFDEVEKCNPDVRNILLQIMDDGYLTDGQGYKVDFTNTIVCMTTNAGASESKSSVGFINTKQGGERFMPAIQREFSPEWLARLDEVVPFNDMSDQMLKQILWKTLSATINKLAPSISLSFNESVPENLFQKLKDTSSHARNVQAMVRREVEIPLAKFILEKRPTKITADYNKTIQFS